MIAVRTLASSSTQGLKMCNDPSETFLSLWHMHKGFFRACDTKGTKEPCPLQLQDLAIFFFHAALSLLPQGSSCVWCHRCSR